jgi:aldose 1-epimerase
MFVVAGSALDLRHRKTIGGIVDSGHPLTKLANGADFNYVLREDGVAAELFSSEDDLRMSVETTCPGLQFYCGQHLGPPFRAFGGLCLEPQYFPDSPNQPAFPGTLLMPGERYLETAGYRFQEES